MIAIKSSLDAAVARKRRNHPGDTGWHTMFLGANTSSLGDRPAPPTEMLYPVAHLLEMDPGCELGAHFHEVNQFQVVVGGGGSFGKMAVQDLMIYFTGVGTTYGPTRAGEDGLSLMTFRTSYDPGARFMPKWRDRLRQLGAKPRHHMTAPHAQLANDALAAITQTSMLPLIVPELDGLAAWVYRIPAGQSVIGPDPRGGGGQYWVVLGGDHQYRHLTQPPRSCLFASQQEAPVEVMAGGQGLEILVLQYPKRAFGSEGAAIQ